MSRPTNLNNFFLRLICVLLLLLAIWKPLSSIYSPLPSNLAAFLANQWVDGLVRSVETANGNASFLTKVEIRHLGKAAAVVPEISTLKHTGGVALFFALCIAARTRAIKTLVGAIVLIPFQALSIAFELLVMVSINMGLQISLQVGLSRTETELAALGYQIGILVAPSLVPVLAWMLVDSDSILTLVRQSGAADASET